MVKIAGFFKGLEGITFVLCGFVVYFKQRGILNIVRLCKNLLVVR
jgi:hypothetical protein